MGGRKAHSVELLAGHSGVGIVMTVVENHERHTKRNALKKEGARLALVVDTHTVHERRKT